MEDISKQLNNFIKKCTRPAHVSAIEAAGVVLYAIADRALEKKITIAVYNPEKNVLEFVNSDRKYKTSAILSAQTFAVAELRKFAKESGVEVIEG